MRSVRRRRALGDARRQPNAAASSCAWRRITEDADELARLESRTTGKPLKQGRADVAAAARYFEFYEEVLERVGAAIAQLRVGPALADNHVGPLIRRNQLQRVWNYLSQAQVDRIAIAAQGSVVDDAPDEAAFITGACLEVDGGRCVKNGSKQKRHG